MSTMKKSLTTDTWGVPCTMDADALLVQLRRGMEQIRKGDHGRVEDTAATFFELDERLGASGQLPNDWKGTE